MNYGKWNGKNQDWILYIYFYTAAFKSVADIKYSCCIWLKNKDNNDKINIPKRNVYNMLLPTKVTKTAQSALYTMWR